MARKNVRWWKNAHRLMAANIAVAAITLASVITAQCFNSKVPTATSVATTYTDTTMDVTAYTPAVGDTTATMKKIRVGRDVAVSRDRLDLLGKRVYIMCPGVNVGVREVTDLMAGNITQCLDILVSTDKEAMQFGRKECTVVPLRD